jgi:hypothetical protein
LDNCRILYVTLQDNEPMKAFELIDGVWMFAKLDDYNEIDHEFVYQPDQESIRGFCWFNERTGLIFDVISDPGFLPHPDRVIGMYHDFMTSLIPDENFIKGLDEVPNAIVFSMDEKYLYSA